MRTAILTDVHANLEALTACIAAAERERVDRFVCLGDTVGYGANPNEACDLVRARCEFAVLGNHDAAVAGRMDYSYYYAAAREVLDWTALHLSPENMAWLRMLPYTKQEGKVLWGHASPRDPEQVPVQHRELRAAARLRPARLLRHLGRRGQGGRVPARAL